MSDHLTQPEEGAAVWNRRLVRLLLWVLAFRLIFLAFFVQSTDLAGDEAYYWDWGRRPDWGYYSKPPMIGWIMAGVSAVSGGGTEWAIRLTSLLMGTVSLAMLYGLVRRLFDGKAALLAVVVVVLTPANAALNLFLTIDAPLVLVWITALLLCWRAGEEPERWGWWLALGGVIGVGVLSKQMMLVFPLLMLIWVVCPAGPRRLLRVPGFWVSMLMGVAALAPVVWWNERHQWITLEHTKHHFNADAKGLADHVETLVQFPALQALLYSPVTWLLTVGVMVRVWKGWRTLSPQAVYLAVFSALPMPVFYGLAMRQAVNPNWPAVYYIGLFALIGAWMAGGLFEKALSARWRTAALLTGGVFTALTYVLPAVVEVAGWRGRVGLDPLTELRGWGEAGKQAGMLLERCPNPERTLVVVLGHRYHAAHMAFEMPQRPQVFRWEKDGSVMSQYEVWAAPEDRVGWDVMVIYPDADTAGKRHQLSRYFRRHFDAVEPLGEIAVGIGNGRNYGAQVLLCRSMNRWPPSIPLQEAEDAADKEKEGSE